jgi:hypothetical protein
VELEGERADLFGELELDEVVDVFGLRVAADVFELRYRSQAFFHLEELFAGEDSGGFDGAGVGYAGFYFVGDEAPIEGEGALPRFEGCVEWFAEAAGPHFGGLLF